LLRTKLIFFLAILGCMVLKGARNLAADVGSPMGKKPFNSGS